MAVEYTGQTLELSDFQAVAGKIPPSTKDGQGISPAPAEKLYPYAAWAGACEAKMKNRNRFNSWWSR